MGSFDHFAASALTVLSGNDDTGNKRIIHMIIEIYVIRRVSIMGDIVISDGLLVKFCF